MMSISKKIKNILENKVVNEDISNKSVINNKLKELPDDKQYTLLKRQILAICEIVDTFNDKQNTSHESGANGFSQAELIYNAFSGSHAKLFLTSSRFSKQVYSGLTVSLRLQGSIHSYQHESLDFSQLDNSIIITGVPSKTSNRLTNTVIHDGINQAFLEYEKNIDQMLNIAKPSDLYLKYHESHIHEWDPSNKYSAANYISKVNDLVKSHN